MGRHQALDVASPVHSDNTLGLGSGPEPTPLSNMVLPKVTEHTSLTAMPAWSWDNVMFGEGMAGCSVLNLTYET